MPPEETTTPDATATPAAVPAETPEVKTEAPATEAKDTLADDFKAASEEIEAKEKTTATPDPKSEGAEAEKEEEEPEFQSDEDKNRATWLKAQRDKNLAESQRLADEKKALADEKSAIAAEKAEIEKAKATQTEEPATKPTIKAELEHYKPVSLAAYSDGDNVNELALKDGIEGLAKDVETNFSAIVAELKALRSDNDRLMKLAAPHIPNEYGYTQAEVDHLSQVTQATALEAVEALKEEYGIDVDPINVLAAVSEFGAGFVRLGEVAAKDALSKEAMLLSWKHANKKDIAGLQAKAPKKDEEKAKPPPLGRGGGKPPAPVKEENLTEKQRIALDYERSLASTNGSL